MRVLPAAFVTCNYRPVSSDLKVPAIFDPDVDQTPDPNRWREIFDRRYSQCCGHWRELLPRTFLQSRSASYHGCQMAFLLILFGHLLAWIL